MVQDNEVYIHMAEGLIMGRSFWWFYLLAGSIYRQVHYAWWFFCLLVLYRQKAVSTGNILKTKT